MPEINTWEIEVLMTDGEQMAYEVANRWSELASSWSVYEKRVAEQEKYIFATTVKDTTNVQGEYLHTTHIPKLTELYDRLKSNYEEGALGREDFFAFEGEDEEAVTIESRALIEAYLRTKHRLRKTRQRLGKSLDDYLYGNCFAEVVYVNEYHDNPDTNSRDLVYSGPEVRTIDMSDIRFNVLATDFRSTPKIVRRYKTLGGLTRDVEQLPQDLALEAQNILNKVERLRTAYLSAPNDITDRYDSITFDGFGTWGTYMKSGIVEVLTFYGDIYNQDTDQWLKNHKVTVVDRRWVITNETINTADGHPHIFHAGWRTRRDNLMGQGPFENVVGMQYRINHLENARADAFDKMLEPDLVLAGDPEVEDGPNGSKLYHIHEQGSVQILNPDTTVLQADLQIDRLEARMELFVGAPRETSGFRSPGEKTKFEVEQLKTAADKVFMNKLAQWEQNFLEPILQAELEVSRQNLNGADTVKLQDPTTGAVEFLTLTREDLYSKGNLIPIGSRHFEKKRRLAQDLNAFVNTGLNDPEVRQHFSSEKLAKLWEWVLEFDEFELVEPYIRITEQTQAARLQSVGSQQLQNEEQDAVEDVIEDAEGLV